MRALFRFLTRGPGGALESRDREFQGEAISLGRATDQVLTLKDRRVDLEHARIVVSAGRVLVTSRALTGVIINGTVCRDGALAPGDVLRIGSNILTLVEPPAGFDLAFNFELDSAADAREATVAPLKLTLSEVGLGKRSWAWGAFIVVLLFALLIPWLTAPASRLLPSVRATPLPSDHAWLPGPLHTAHRTFGLECERCHARPFEPVRDVACLSCHANGLHLHTANAQYTPSSRLGAARCASCHAEHNEPSTLVSTDEKLCVDCHRQLDAAAGQAVRNAQVSDFSRDHPEFRVSMLTPGGASTRHMRLDATPLQENSGLRFSHRKHLVPAGIKSTQGTRVLECVDCHRPDAGGQRMRPVRMADHCVACHALNFDPREPARTVPHGSPDKVVESLVEYYAASYLAGYPDALGTSRPGRTALLPGRDLSAAERSRLLTAAREKARSVARDLFERRTCQTCHVVTAGADAASWQVRPVRLTQQWMPNALFNHAAHATSLTPCGSCHKAQLSEDAGDVLMPKIAICRQCHGGTDASASNRLRSGCTQCHAFHIAGNPLWSASRADLQPRPVKR